MSTRHANSCLKYISRVKILLPALSRRSKSTRLFLGQFQSGYLKQVNPDCRLETIVVDSPLEAKIALTLKDGKMVDIEASKHSFDEIMTLVKRNTRHLREQEQESMNA